MVMSVEDLFASQTTEEDEFDALKQRATTAPYPIPADTAATPGTHENAIMHALAAGLSAMSEERMRWATAGYRSTADRESLALLMQQMYGLPPREEDYATCDLEITNAGGGVFGPFDPGTYRVSHEVTNKVFENLAEFSIDPNTTLTIGVRAVDPGSDSNAAVGTLTNPETPLEGVSVQNTTPALGQDAEDTLSMNTRIDARIGFFGVPGAAQVSSGGPDSAVKSVAFSGVDGKGGCKRSDGSRVTVTRAFYDRDDATGIGTLYIADDDGAVETSDVAFVNDEVQTYCEWIGQQVTVENTVNLEIPLTFTITVRKTSLTDGELQAIIEAGLPLAARRVDVGGFLFSGPTAGAVPFDFIEGAIAGTLAGKAEVIRNDLQDPSDVSGWVDVAANETPFFTVDSMSVERI